MLNFSDKSFNTFDEVKMKKNKYNLNELQLSFKHENFE